MAPPTARRRSRIAGFKAPFLVSVAGPAVLGLACGGRTEREPGVTPGALTETAPACAEEPCPEAPSASCPAQVPEVGTSCEGHEPGLSCEGPYCYGTTPLVRCGADGLWEQIELPTCNPPPPEPPAAPCSVEMPVPGSDCLYPDQECFYPGCEGPTSSWARCSHGQWLIDYSIGPACNPPAVVPVCPEVEPSAGAGCAYRGQECGYGACDGASGSSARRYHCDELGWDVTQEVCAARDAGAAVDAGAAPGLGLP